MIHFVYETKTNKLEYCFSFFRLFVGLNKRGGGERRRLLTALSHWWVMVGNFKLPTRGLDGVAAFGGFGFGSNECAPWCVHTLTFVTRIWYICCESRDVCDCVYDGCALASQLIRRRLLEKWGTKMRLTIMTTAKSRFI